MQKIKLELVIGDDNEVMFLNYWNWYNAKDVCTEIVDGKIIDDNGDGKEITFMDFINEVKKRVAEIPPPEEFLKRKL